MKLRVVLVFGGRTTIPRSSVNAQVIDGRHSASPFLWKLWRIATGAEIGRFGWSLELLVLHNSVLAKQMMSQHASQGLQDAS